MARPADEVPGTAGPQPQHPPRQTSRWPAGVGGEVVVLPHNQAVNRSDRAASFPSRRRPSASRVPPRAAREDGTKGIPMRAQRARRVLAVSAAGVLMAGGAAIGAAGTAAAYDSSNHNSSSYSSDCDNG